MEKGADISADGRYRYRLWRRWGPGRDILWIMLNPSTADARTDDPTIRRCIGFSKAWGFGGLQVINLYALRATKPKQLLEVSDPEGPENLRAWHDAGWGTVGGAVLAAWGERVAMRGLRRSSMFPGGNVSGLSCLGVTRDGHPRHPLRLSHKTTTVPWTGSQTTMP